MLQCLPCILPVWMTPAVSRVDIDMRRSGEETQRFEMPGLVAQGRTVRETVEIARDVARQIIEARAEKGSTTPLEPIGDTLEYPLIIGD